MQELWFEGRYAGCAHYLPGMRGCNSIRRTSSKASPLIEFYRTYSLRRARAGRTLNASSDLRLLLLRQSRFFDLILRNIASKDHILWGCLPTRIHARRACDEFQGISLSRILRNSRSTEFRLTRKLTVLVLRRPGPLDP